jgi:thiosulfate dehydrogenase [quinone] large subunit
METTVSPETLATVSGRAFVSASDKIAAAPKSGNLKVADWLFRSNYASVIWLALRIWLGYQWLSAGYQKIWGSEKAFFWNGGGAGVYGFAKGGVAANATSMGAVGYGWWAAFLHNFVMPNASWIAKAISLGELAIGIGLILGLFTGLAALVAMSLNFTYMMTGNAGVNPLYFVAGLALVLAWRNAGLLGLDGLAFRRSSSPFYIGAIVRKVTHRQPPLSVQRTDTISV